MQSTECVNYLQSGGFTLETFYSNIALGCHVVVKKKKKKNRKIQTRS